MKNWTQVHEQYGPLVWTTVYRILGHHSDAQDCCQDVIVEAAGSVTQEIRDWPAFMRWLAVRRALDRLRKRRAESARFNSQNSQVGAANIATTELQPDSQAMWSELIERLKEELILLPDRQDEVFWLRNVDGLTYEEIAAATGLDANHVGVLLHRARQKLRQRLAELDPLKR
jgi:RNA polymerase sigma-70 factor, ECF subfamily